MRFFVKTISFWSLPGLLVAILASGIIAVSIARDSIPRLILEKEGETDAALVSRWIAAIEKGDIQGSLLMAEKIISPVRIEVPDADYMQTVTDSGLSTTTVTESFNTYDFMRWNDAMELRKAFKINARNDASAVLTEILEKLNSRIRLDTQGQPPTAPQLSLKTVLNRGHGDTEEIRRLFCEAAYQNGFETMAVNAYLPDRSLLERFCEIRKDGQVWTVLPHRMMIIGGKSVGELMQDSKELDRLLPGKPGLKPDTLVFALPAEFQDYRTVNQRLASKLGKFEGCPIFGEDPRGRIDKFLRHYQNARPPGIFTYWNYPFSVLLAQKDLPFRFRLHPDSPKSSPEK